MADQKAAWMLYEQARQTTASSTFSLFELSEEEDEGSLDVDYVGMTERLMGLV